MPGAVTSLIGTVTGANAMSAANRNQRRAIRLQEQQYADSKTFYDKLMMFVDQLRARGQFDKQSRIASFDRDFDLGVDRALQSSAAADRIAGAKPGDSSPVARRNAIAAQAAIDRARAHDDIGRQVGMEEFGMMQGTRPDFSQGNALSQTLQNDAALTRQNAPSPTGFLAALMPFLNRPRSASTSLSTSRGGSNATSGTSQSLVRAW